VSAALGEAQEDHCVFTLRTLEAAESTLGLEELEVRLSEDWSAVGLEEGAETALGIVDAVAAIQTLLRDTIHIGGIGFQTGTGLEEWPTLKWDEPIPIRHFTSAAAGHTSSTPLVIQMSPRGSGNKFDILVGPASTPSPGLPAVDAARMLSLAPRHYQVRAVEVHGETQQVFPASDFSLLEPAERTEIAQRLNQLAGGKGVWVRFVLITAEMGRPALKVIAMPALAGQEEGEDESVFSNPRAIVADELSTVFGSIEDRLRYESETKSVMGIAGAVLRMEEDPGHRRAVELTDATDERIRTLLGIQLPIPVPFPNESLQYLMLTPSLFDNLADRYERHDLDFADSDVLEDLLRHEQRRGLLGAALTRLGPEIEERLGKLPRTEPIREMPTWRQMTHYEETMGLIHRAREWVESVAGQEEADAAALDAEQAAQAVEVLFAHETFLDAVQFQTADGWESPVPERGRDPRMARLARAAAVHSPSGQAVIEVEPGEVQHRLRIVVTPVEAPSSGLSVQRAVEVFDLIHRHRRVREIVVQGKLTQPYPAANFGSLGTTSWFKVAQEVDRLPKSKGIWIRLVPTPGRVEETALKAIVMPAQVGMEEKQQPIFEPVSLELSVEAWAAVQPNPREIELAQLRQLASQMSQHPRAIARALERLGYQPVGPESRDGLPSGWIKTAGQEETSPQSAWTRLRSASPSVRAVVIGESVLQQFPALKTLTGLEENRFFFDEGADTVVGLISAGLNEVHYYGGLEEANAFTAIADRGLVSVTHRLPTQGNLFNQLHGILAAAGIPDNVITTGLEEFAAELERLAPAA